MTKYRLKFTFVFILLTGFLTTQWASAHIHLADQHSHDGSEHSHKIEAHAHLPQLALSHHASTIDDAIDVATTQAHHHNSISINQEYVASSPEKIKKQPLFAIKPNNPPQISFLQVATPLPEAISTSHYYHFHPSIQPRAPPLYPIN